MIADRESIVITFCIREQNSSLAVSHLVCLFVPQYATLAVRTVASEQFYPHCVFPHYCCVCSIEMSLCYYYYLIGYLRHPFSSFVINTLTLLLSF